MTWFVYRTVIFDHGYLECLFLPSSGNGHWCKYAFPFNVFHEISSLFIYLFIVVIIIIGSVIRTSLLDIGLPFVRPHVSTLGCLRSVLSTLSYIITSAHLVFGLLLCVLSVVFHFNTKFSWLSVDGKGWHGKVNGWIDNTREMRDGMKYAT